MSFHFVGLWSRAAVQYFPELLHVVCGPIPHLLHIKQILLWLRYFSSSCFYLLLCCSITTVDVCFKTGWIYLPNAPTRLKHAVIPSLFHRQGAEAQNCIYRPNGKSVPDKATAQGSKIPAFCINSFFLFPGYFMLPRSSVAKAGMSLFVKALGNNKWKWIVLVINPSSRTKTGDPTVTEIIELMD